MFLAFPFLLPPLGSRATLLMSIGITLLCFGLFALTALHFGIEVLRQPAGISMRLSRVEPTLATFAGKPVRARGQCPGRSRHTLLAHFRDTSWSGFRS